MLHIHTITAGPLAVNAYVASDGGECVVIDAPHESTKAVCEFINAKKLKPLTVINTHGHFDHIGDNEELQKALGCPIATHILDAKMLARPYDYGWGFQTHPSKADKLLNDGDEIKVGACKLLVMHTPGHTTGSMCLYEAAEDSKTEGILFTGDTLFAGGVGRTDLSGGSQELLEKSLKKLLELPPATKVYPGHGPATTIGEERKNLKKLL